ncbi:unnamed protein product [Gongylonema pulchrum]|uniref:PDZ domain-containing protein n=1 Tax=Gongylonema pulchrum TaxID=637853 RepID=A0A3P7RCE3_9BILA|nr:unnamed protein product [Gongylonema pulchrum]
MGLIITDNGVGKAFIKRIAAGTVTAKANPAIEVGDYIESINDESMVGRRHFDVARYLRTLPVGTTLEAPNNLLISKMNDIFNSYLGFHDDELAHTVCELAATSENVNDFMNTLKTV